MSELIMPFSLKQDRYQLIEIELTNGRRVMAITSPFIDIDSAKQVFAKRIIAYEPKVIPPAAKNVFAPLFEILRNVINK